MASPQRPQRKSLEPELTASAAVADPPTDEADMPADAKLRVAIAIGELGDQLLAAAMLANDLAEKLHRAAEVIVDPEVIADVLLERKASTGGVGRPA